MLVLAEKGGVDLSRNGSVCVRGTSSFKPDEGGRVNTLEGRERRGDPQWGGGYEKRAFGRLHRGGREPAVGPL